MQSSLDQENQLILMKQMSENKLFNLIKRIDDKESSWIAWESFKKLANQKYSSNQQHSFLKIKHLIIRLH